MTDPDPAILLKSIAGKIASTEDPAQMLELTLLAIDMLLRRAEEKPLHDRLAKAARSATAGLGADADPVRRQAAVEACTEVLQAARQQRQPRDVILIPDLRPGADVAQTAALPHRHQPLAVYGAFALLAVAMLGSVVMLLRPALRPDLPAAPITAVTLAVEMVAMAAPQPQVPASVAPVKLFAAHDRVGTALIIARSVPRQICAETARLLARQGAITVNGLAPARKGGAELAHLCDGRGGDADITWSPQPL